MYASSGVEMCRVSEGSVGGGRVCVSGVWGGIEWVGVVIGVLWRCECVGGCGWV